MVEFDVARAEWAMKRAHALEQAAIMRGDWLAAALAGRRRARNQVRAIKASISRRGEYAWDRTLLEMFLRHMEESTTWARNTLGRSVRADRFREDEHVQRMAA